MGQGVLRSVNLRQFLCININMAGLSEVDHIFILLIIECYACT